MVFCFVNTTRSINSFLLALHPYSNKCHLSVEPPAASSSRRCARGVLFGARRRRPRARTPPAVPSRRSAKANRKFRTNSETKPLRTRESAGFRNLAPALFLAASLPCPLDCIPLLHYIILNFEHQIPYAPRAPVSASVQHSSSPARSCDGAANLRAHLGAVEVLLDGVVLLALFGALAERTHGGCEHARGHEARLVAFEAQARG